MNIKQHQPDTSISFSWCYKMLGILSLVFIPMLHFGQGNTNGDIRILNYDQNSHKGGPQTWDIEVTSSGGVFFANNNGLIQFDGLDFHIYQLPNHTIVRSVMEARDGLIYVGGQNEFGYFEPVNTGLVYHSLSSNLPDSVQDFTDVWKITELSSSIVFQSSNYLFIKKGEEVTPIRIEGQPITLSNNIDDTLVFADEGGNVKMLDRERVKMIHSLDEYGPIVIRHLDGNMDSILLFTLKNGILKINNGRSSEWKNGLEFLKDAAIYSVAKSKEGYVIATSRDGVYHISFEGEVLQHISQQDGLQNDNVLSVDVDSFGNFWVGLNRGIDFIANSAPYRFLVPDGNLKGTGYAAKKFNGKLYLATNNGLYVNEAYGSQNLESRQFTLVENSEGQVWSLNEINGNLYMSHHEGLFRIAGNEAIKVSPSTGSWLVQMVPGKPIVIEGTYYGINRYTLENNQLIYQGKITENFDESSRLMAIDQQRIWIAHPYRGLFMVKMNENWSAATEVKRYANPDGFNSELNIHVFKVFGEVVFTDEKGIYRYDPNSDRFLPHREYSEYFDTTTFVRYLNGASDGNIWYATMDEIGYLDVDEQSLSKSIQKRIIPPLPIPLTGGFENISVIDENIVFASEAGFVVLPMEKLNTYLQYQPTPQIVSVKAMGKTDSTIVNAGYFKPEESIELPNSFSGIMVEVSSLNQALNPTTQFQFKLQGHSDDWSAWTMSNTRMFNFLASGDYKLMIRSRLMDNVSEPVSISFNIAPPWYRTTTAITVFSIGLAGFLGLLIFLPSIRFKREKQALQQKQAEQIREKEEAFQNRFKESKEKIDRLKNEKLEVEIKSKNQQLASTTMHLVQKGEFLLKMKEELGNIKKNTEKADVKKHINKLIRTIENDSQIDDNWESFEMAFDQVHVNFTQRLKEKYPQLTPNDIKLCTYLKLNLSSKEIASLTNISVRGVEISRYRLRKKLELDSSDNLVEFVQSI